MMPAWRSTPLGQRLASATDWSLSIDGDRFILTVEGVTNSGSVLQLESLTLRVTCPARISDHS
jgi:hypothetical protein